MVNCAANSSVALRGDLRVVSSACDLDEGRKAAVLTQLDCILRSPVFCNAGRMQRFLALVVRETLAGRAEKLKEYTIAVDALARPRTFSPIADPVVRVEARRLRQKLADYYRLHGARDEVVIEVPTGQYVPSFSFRAGVPPASSAGEATLTVQPFSSVPSGALEVSEALLHELLDQFVRLHGVCVRTGSGDLRSTWLLSGCVQMSPKRTRVVAHLTTAPRFECRWSTALTSEASDAAAECVAAVIASRVVEYLSQQPPELR